MKHREQVKAYIDGVLSGDIIAGKYVRDAVRRHLDDLENGADRGLHFDEYYANRAISFFPVLKHTTGEYAGEPFELRSWQKFIVWCLFGWRFSDGSRRFRWAYISIARGNGKSPFGAALGNYLFLADEPTEPRAQIYAFATKEAQARQIVFEEAKKQIESSPELSELVERRAANMAILEHPWNGSVFEPKGSDSKKSDGWILHGGIIDELHEWRDSQRKMLEKIETSMGKRKHPLCVIITTAGDDDSTIWEEQYDFYCDIVSRDNDLDSDRHFAYIAQVDEDEKCPQCAGSGCQYCDQLGRVPIDPLDESLWAQANPMLAEPRSPVKIDELRSFAAKAKIMPSAENTFRRYYANQRVASFYKLITPEMWNRGDVSNIAGKISGQACHAGFDWGWRNDLAALVLEFPIDGRFYVVPYVWIPSDGPRDLTREPWSEWIRHGLVTVTDGNTTDIDAIYGKTEEITKLFELKTLAADPNNCREYLTRCANDWGIETYEFYQTTKKYHEPLQDFCQQLVKGNVIHGGHSLLGWSARNATVREDPAGYRMPSKAKSKDKIDPFVAMIMAHSECMFADTEQEWTEEYAGL